MAQTLPLFYAILVIFRLILHFLLLFGVIKDDLVGGSWHCTLLLLGYYENASANIDKNTKEIMFRQNEDNKIWKINNQITRERQHKKNMEIERTKLRTHIDEWQLN